MRRATAVTLLIWAMVGASFAQVAPVAPAAPAAPAEYLVGPQDVLTISVYDQPGLSNKFVVEADGMIQFPLIGRVKVSGLTLRDVEGVIARKLVADEYLKRAQVTAAVDQFRSQQISVHGEVRTPGVYALRGEMTLIEALASAGGATGDAGHALIVRPKRGVAADPTRSPTASTDDADIITVDIEALRSGRTSQNVALRDNDTIFVTRAEKIFIDGEVKNPGAYTYTKGMTVRQALALAGGATERGALNRLKVGRMIDGKRTEPKIGLDDPIQPGDTISVPERYL